MPPGHTREESAGSAGPVTLVTTADVTDLAAARSIWTERAPSWTDLVVRAASLALRQHPRLNATMDDRGITLHEDVHIGIAVALGDGLVVPVIRNADARDLADLVAEGRRLADLARSGAFTPDDVTGSTFTVTSLGGRGIDAFTPILNTPEVAILGVGRVADAATRGEDGSVVWRKLITLSLTVDHRAVDGVPGADFLQAVGELLGSPELLGA